jgi:hypothetical protein
VNTTATRPDARTIVEVITGVHQTAAQIPGSQTPAAGQQARRAHPASLHPAALATPRLTPARPCTAPEPRGPGEPPPSPDASNLTSGRALDTRPTWPPSPVSTPVDPEDGRASRPGCVLSTHSVPPRLAGFGDRLPSLRILHRLRPGRFKVPSPSPCGLGSARPGRRYRATSTITKPPRRRDQDEPHVCYLELRPDSALGGAWVARPGARGG